MENLTTAELAASEDKLLAQYEECYAFSETEYNSDAEWTTERQAKYAANRDRLLALQSKIELTRSKRRDREITERKVPVNKQSALARAVKSALAGKDPRNGLEAWEAKRFIDFERDPSNSDTPAPTGATFSFALEYDETARQAPELLAQPQYSDDSDTRNIMPREVMPRLTERLQFIGNVGSVVESVNTSDGNPLVFYHRNAIGSTSRGKIFWTQASAGAGVAEVQTPDIEGTEFRAVDISSEEIPIARRMLTDLRIDFDGAVRREAMHRIGERWNRACVKTESAGGPDVRPANTMQSLISMSAGNSDAIASKTAITFAEVKRWRRAIGYAYRYGSEGNPYGYQADMGRGMVGFLFHETLFDILNDLDDGNGRPLWRPLLVGSLGTGPGGLIGEYPYQVNNAFDPMVDAASTGSVPGVFGNFNYFTERTVGAPELFLFFDSRTGRKNQVSYLVWDRRFFGPTGAVTAGTGVDDATRVESVARITLP